MGITQRLAMARKMPEDDTDLKVFEDWKDGMKRQSDRDARLAVKHEMDSHAGIVSQCQSDVTSANTAKETAESSLRECIAKLATCEESLTRCKQSLAVMRLEQSPISDENINLKLTVAERNIEVAGLKGKLSEKPKVIREKAKPAKTVTKQVTTPVVIPTFEFTPTRGPDGMATLWTATPKRLN